jgi:hypothetical protein
MEPFLSLLISVVVILVLIRKIKIGYSVLIGTVLLSVLTLGSKGIYEIFKSFLDISNAEIVAIVILAFALAQSMEKMGMLKGVSSSLSPLSGVEVALIPLLIGLLPMPGGALVSAVMISSLASRYQIDPERMTFINYWFRHIWVTVWPLYPNVIIASAVMDTDFRHIIGATYPIALAAIISAIPFSRGLFRKPSKPDLHELVVSFSPIILVAALALLFKMSLLLSLLIAILLLFAIKREFKAIPEVFKRSVDLEILVLVFAVLAYRDLIIISGAAEDFLNAVVSAGISSYAAAFLLSFFVAFSTGIEMSYTSIALPLLTPFTGTGDINQNFVLLIFAAGFAGVMLSPLHLCIVLSAKHFNANLRKVYHYLIPASIIMLLLVFAFL